MIGELYRFYMNKEREREKRPSSWMDFDNDSSNMCLLKNEKEINK
jgi:hypothetical protein